MAQATLSDGRIIRFPDGLPPERVKMIIQKASGNCAPASPDLARVKRNIQRMIDQNAPETEIDAYVASEGTSPQELRAFKDTGVIVASAQCVSAFMFALSQGEKKLDRELTESIQNGTLEIWTALDSVRVFLETECGTSAKDLGVFQDEVTIQ